MIDTNETKMRITQLLEQKLNIEVANVSDEGQVQDMELNLDSMALLELSVNLEKEFSITLDDDDLATPENFKSLQSLSDLVSAKMA